MIPTDLRSRPPDNATLVAAILGTDLYSFVQASFPIVSGGGHFLPNWHIEAICHELSQVINGRTRRLIITVPPRSLKSICASVCLPAFILGHDPARRIICVSYSEGLARKHANDCRALMRSNLYRAVFPTTRISPAKDTETEVMTTARGSRLATSVGGVGHLLEQEGWRHLNLPAIAEEESSVRLSATRSFRRRMGGLLHPERESQSALDELKASMGTMEFSAQYQQAPVPAGGNLIKWSWFKFYDRPPIPLPSDKVIISWDTALSSSQLADYSACVVLLVRHQSIYILDVIRARLEYPDLKRAVLENYHRWRRMAPSCALVIERKGSGLSLMQDLRRDNIHAIGITPEGDKIMRMAAQTAPIEAGAVHLPARAPWVEEFKKEILSFPASKHDDQIDALSQALQRAFAPGPPVAVFGTYGMGS